MANERKLRQKYIYITEMTRKEIAVFLFEVDKCAFLTMKLIRACLNAIYSFLIPSRCEKGINFQVSCSSSYGKQHSISGERHCSASDNFRGLKNSHDIVCDLGPHAASHEEN